MTPVFHGLMNRTVNVYDTTADGWPQLPWSPMPAAIQGASAATNDDLFYVRWPGATWSLWCARDRVLRKGCVLRWRAPDGTVTHGVVMGTEDERGHSPRVALQEVLV